MKTRILQLTDLHVFADAETRLRNVATRYFLAAVVKQIRDSGEHFDHVVITGDHTHDELPGSYDAVGALMSPWTDRLWQVPGNHDDRSVMRQVWPGRFSGQQLDWIQFHFQAGPWCCIGLDTHLPGSVAGQVTRQQIEWARSLANRPGVESVALFLHHPPVLMGSVWMDKIGLDGKEQIQAWCCQDPRVRLICCGHVHHASETLVGSATVVTTPSTGIQFSRAGVTPTFVSAAPGYRIIELGDDCFRTEVRRIHEVSSPQ